MVTEYGSSWKGDTTTGVVETNVGHLQLMLSKRDMPLFQQCFKRRQPRIRGYQGPTLGHFLKPQNSVGLMNLQFLAIETTCL